MNSTRLAGRVAGGVVVVGLALVLLPDIVALDRITPFAQLVAFRPVVLAVATAVVAGPLVVLLVRLRARWFVAAVLAVLVATAGTLVTRVLPGADNGGSSPALTVLAVNVYDGAASVAETATLIASERPDLVALPEAGAEFRARLAPLVEPLGYRLFGSTAEGVGDIEGVSALAHADVGEVSATVDATTPFPSVVLTLPGGLRFVAFHSIAPVPDGIRQWRSDLAHVATWCAAPTPAIVAGDFNATLDHSPFRTGTAGCADAAEQAGAGLVGTWPSRWPRALGTQIDHVIATRDMAAETFEVHDVTGTDHRAVLTRLRTAPNGT